MKQVSVSFVWTCPNETIITHYLTLKLNQSKVALCTYAATLLAPRHTNTISQDHWLVLCFLQGRVW